MGDNLSGVLLGVGRTATDLAVGGGHVCALLDNGAIKCWGVNSSGELGQGDTANRGDNPSEMGDNLPPIFSLSAPKNLTGISLGVSSISWSWSDVFGEAGYRVIASTGGNISGDLAPGTTAWGQINLSTNANFDNRIAAFNSSGVSTSTSVTGWTMAGLPAISGFNVFSTSISVILNSLTNPAGTKLVVSAGSDRNFSVASSSVGPSGPPGSNITLTILDLFPNTSYAIEAAAINGASPASTTTAVFVTNSTTTARVSISSTSLIPTFASINTSSLTITWTGVPNATFIAVLDDTSNFSSTLASDTLSFNTTTFIGLSAATSYYFQVKLSTEPDIAYAANRISTVTKLLTVAGAMRLVPAFTNVFVSSLSINWLAISGASFKAVLASDSGYSGVISSGSLSNSATTYSGLTSSATYYFQVKLSTEPDMAYSANRISTVTLPPAPVPVLSINSSALNFGAVKIGETSTQSFNITNTGPGALSGTIASDSGWLSVSPASFSGNTTIFVTANASGLGDGQFSGQVQIASNGGNASVLASVQATCVLTKPNPYSLSTGRPLVFWGSGVVPNDTRIRVYTLAGDLVATIQETNGKNEISWDGRNTWGNRVVPGIYLYTTVSPTEKNAGKFTVIR